MITIIKDGNKMQCSQNTYDTMYKRLGYEILAPKKETKEISKNVKENTIKEKEDEKLTKVTPKTKVTRNKDKKGE